MQTMQAAGHGHDVPFYVFAGNTDVSPQCDGSMPKSFDGKVAWIRIPPAQGQGRLPDLGVTMTDSPDPVAVGADLTYTIQVSNSGTLAASEVKLTDTLPPGATFVSATVVGSGGTCSQAGGTVTCSLGAVHRDTTQTVTIVVRPTATGSITNDVSVAANENDRNTGDTRITVSTTVNPAPPADARLYVGGDKGLYAKFADGTWANRKPPITLGLNGVASIASPPGSPNTLYAIVSDSNGDHTLWKSIDAGTNWTQLTPAEFPAFLTGRVFATASKVYISVNDSATGGVWESANGGTSWTRIVDNPTSAMLWVYVGTSRIWLTGFMFTPSTHHLHYTALDGSGHQHITLPGQVGNEKIWGTPGSDTRAWSVRPTYNNTAKIHRLDDSTVTDVTPLAPGASQTWQWVAAKSPSTALAYFLDNAGGNSKLYKTTDGGSSWAVKLDDSRLARSELGQNDDPSVMWRSQSPTDVYAVAGVPNVAKSADDGESWDFESIDPAKAASEFGFNCLAVAE